MKFSPEEELVCLKEFKFFEAPPSLYVNNQFINTHYFSLQTYLLL